MNRKILDGMLDEIAWHRAHRAPDVWANVPDPQLLLLHLAATVGVFTPGQAVRFFRQSGGPLSTLPHETVHAALEALVEERRWLGRLSAVRLPPDCGGHEARVHYLTPDGARAIGRKFPDHFTARYLRVGRPRGSLRDRVPHDLLVTEAYLHVMRAREVKIFVCERELRSLVRVARLRSGARHEGPETPGESCGDFALYARLRDGSFGWVECEVTRRLDYEKIGGKPDGLLWFASEGVKKDTVESAKGRGARVVLIGGVCEPCPSEPCPDPPGRTAGGAGAAAAAGALTPLDRGYWEGLTGPERLLLREVERFGAVTMGALAGVLGLEESGVRRRVARLRGSGHLAVEAVHLHPGLDVGRRPFLCCPTYREPLESLAARQHHLMVSVAAAKLTGAGLTLKNYDKASGTLELRSDFEWGVPPHLVVVDDPRETVAEIKNRFRAAAASAVSPELLVFMTDGRRVAEMQRLCPEATILDFSEERG